MWLLVSVVLIFPQCRCYRLADSIQPTMQIIDGRLDGINNTLLVAQHQIVNIQSQLNGMSAGHQFELKDILSKLLQLQEKLEKTCLLVEENQQKISDLQAALAQIGDSMTSVEDDMARLKESNKLWKNNFVIVNRTFTQLRNSGCL